MVISLFSRVDRILVEEEEEEETFFWSWRNEGQRGDIQGVSFHSR